MATSKLNQLLLLDAGPRLDFMQSHCIYLLLLSYLYYCNANHAQFDRSKVEIKKKIQIKNRYLQRDVLAFL